MRRRIAIGGISMFLILYLIGCEKSSRMATEPSNPVSSQARDAITGLISNDALFTADASVLGDGPVPLAKADAAILPRYWGRWIKDASRNIILDQVNDSTVVATININLTGQVWIRTRIDSVDTTLFKPLQETVVHKARFIKINGRDSAEAHWRLADVSGTWGGTGDGGITIQDVKFFSEADTVEVTDPLNTYFHFGRGFGRWGCPQLISNPAAVFKVQVTVISTDPDSDVIVAHRPLWFGSAFAYRRAPMKLISSSPNGNGTFTRIYEHSWSGAFIGRFNVFVGAITRQSIYDDTAPFSSNIWGIPYIVNTN